MAGGSMPKPGAEALTAFDAVVPAAAGVTIRPMFGNRAAFVNGNMFAGLFGDGLFVRLPESRLTAVHQAGGGPFEPMAGRPMKGYALVPEGWTANLPATRNWVAEALEFTAGLPAKKPAAKKK